MKRVLSFIMAVMLFILVFGCFLTGCSYNEAVDESSSAISASDSSDMTRSTAASMKIDKDGEYTSPEDVALYIHTYYTLPKNYITKNEAKRLGWDSGDGNLDEAAPGKSIGGDRYGNYEKKLPKNEKYKECDVNYHGGYRGAERLIYTSGGTVYYTNDHYKSFKKLY